MQFEITTPYPPTVNHYWYHGNGKHFVTGKGKQYRTDVVAELTRQKPFKRFKNRIGVEVLVYPPDRRRRDIDNILKASLDALTHGGLIEDDSLIDELQVKRKEVVKNGKLIMRSWEI